MIVIRVMFRIQAEHSSQFSELIQADLAQARKMPGCLHFGLFADPTDAQAFLLYEEWASQADFEAYKNSDAFKANSARIFPLMDGRPASAYFAAEVLEQH